MAHRATAPRRRPCRLGVAGLVGLLLATMLGLGPVTGQGVAPATPTGAAAFVGTWLTTVSPRGRAPLPSLTTYGADGTLIVSRPPVSPAPTGGDASPIVSSTGQGVWAWTGARTIAIVVVFLQTDQDGHALGSQTIRGTDQLAPDGQTFSGVGTLTVSDPQGHVLATSTVTARGTRLTLATPSPRSAAGSAPS